MPGYSGSETALRVGRSLPGTRRQPFPTTGALARRWQSGWSRPLVAHRPLGPPGIRNDAGIGRPAAGIAVDSSEPWLTGGGVAAVGAGPQAVPKESPRVPQSQPSPDHRCDLRGRLIEQSVGPAPMRRSAQSEPTPPGRRPLGTVVLQPLRNSPRLRVSGCLWCTDGGVFGTVVAE